MHYELEDQALALAEAGRLSEALPRFAAAAALSPSADGWRNVGHALSELERPAEALEQYMRASRLAPAELLDDVADAHIAVARHAQARGAAPHVVRASLEASARLRPTIEVGRMLASAEHAAGLADGERGRWHEVLSRGNVWPAACSLQLVARNV